MSPQPNFDSARRNTLRTLPDRLLATSAIGLLALFLIQVIACEAPPTDDPDSESESTHSATRIVTLGGPITEIVFALGAGDQVVAVDRSSEYPPETAELVQLDYFRQTSVESVLAQRPDRVLASEGMGPPEVIEQLESAGVEVIIFDDITAIDGAARRIADVGQTLNREEEANRLIDALDERLSEADRLSQQVETRPRALFLYARGPQTVMLGGHDTGAAAMIEAAGGRHIGDFSGFRPVSAEGLIDAAPEVVVMTNKGKESLESEEALWSLPGLSETPAGRSQQVITVDDLALLGFGPRMGAALSDLSRAFVDIEGDR